MCEKEFKIHSCFLLSFSLFPSFLQVNSLQALHLESTTASAKMAIKKFSKARLKKEEEKIQQK